MKTDPVRKVYVEKNLMFSCCPEWELKSHDFVSDRKLIDRSNSVWDIFHSFQSIICTYCWDFSHTWAAFLVDLLGLRFHSFERRHGWSAQKILIKTLCPFSDFLNRRSIMFLAGADRVKNLHCVVVMLFISANKTTTLALCWNIRWLWSSILPTCLKRRRCSGYRDTIQCRSTSRQYFRLPCAWNNTVYFFNHFY